MKTSDRISLHGYNQNLTLQPEGTTMKRLRKKLTAVFTAALLLTGTAPNLPGGGKLLRLHLTASAEDTPTGGTWAII